MSKKIHKVNELKKFLKNKKESKKIASFVARVPLSNGNGDIGDFGSLLYELIRSDIVDFFLLKKDLEVEVFVGFIVHLVSLTIEMPDTKERDDLIEMIDQLFIISHGLTNNTTKEAEKKHVNGLARVRDEKLSKAEAGGL